MIFYRKRESMKNFYLFLILIFLFLFSNGNLSLAAGTTEQTNYWFRDDDGSEAEATGYGASDALVNENIMNVFGGTNLRIRISFKAASSDVVISPRIEYKEAINCDGGGWSAITASSDNFKLESSPNFNDGASTAQQISSGQFISGQILESTNPASSTTIPKNKSTEYEWSIKLSEAIQNDATYAFRISDGGVALNTYSACALLTTKLTAVPDTGVVWSQTDYWFRDDDGSETTASGLTVQNILKNTPLQIHDQNVYNAIREFRLRFALRANNDVGAIKPRLEFKSGKDGCSDSGGWQILGANTKAEFVLRDSPNIFNNTPTTQQLTAGPGFTPGLFLDAQNSSSDFSVVARNGKIEYEWSLKNAVNELAEMGPDNVYYFRLTNDGAPLSLYSACPNLLFGLTPAGQPTEIRFSGQAYPESVITIYAKDSNVKFPIKQEEIKSSDGAFDISYTGILPNVYNYILTIADKEGKSSQIKSYSLDVYANSLVLKNIFAPPTLGMLKPAVVKSDSVSAAGYGSPGSEIGYEVDDGVINGKTNVEKDGTYKITFDAAGLNSGEHRLKTRQVAGYFGLRKSDWSPVVIFTIYDLQNPKADFNGDGKINIQDAGIFLTRWYSKDDDKKMKNDLNGDGKINISDFSVFMKAFWASPLK